MAKSKIGLLFRRSVIQKKRWFRFHFFIFVKYIEIFLKSSRLLLRRARDVMKLYVQLMIIFSISLFGEGISNFFHLPIPGSIIGLILLFFSFGIQMATIASCKHGR